MLPCTCCTSTSVRVHVVRATYVQAGALRSMNAQLLSSSSTTTTTFEQGRTDTWYCCTGCQGTCRFLSNAVLCTAVLGTDLLSSEFFFYHMYVAYPPRQTPDRVGFGYSKKITRISKGIIYVQHQGVQQQVSSS